MVQAPNPDKENEMISIHYAPATGYRETNNLTSANMYFTLEDAHQTLPQCLQNWFVNSEKLNRVLQMYNWAISRKLFVDEQFMIYIRAVEVCHRLMYDGTFMDKGLFDDVKKQLKNPVRELLPSDTNKELRRRIYENLNWANSFSLKDRLYDIQERHQPHSKRLFEKYDPFVEDVVNTRNYLTHFVERYREKAKLELEDLYIMRERLRIILEVCLLSELELDDSELQRIIYWNVETLVM